jgi:hypothetical protein
MTARKRACVLAAMVVVAASTTVAAAASTSDDPDPRLSLPPRCRGLPVTGADLDAMPRTVRVQSYGETRWVESRSSAVVSTAHARRAAQTLRRRARLMSSVRVVG